jgi:hypothetical protein
MDNYKITLPVMKLFKNVIKHLPPRKRTASPFQNHSVNDVYGKNHSLFCSEDQTNQQAFF